MDNESEKFQFRIAPGVGASLMHIHDDRAYYIFDGDLGLLGTIYARLLEEDFPVVKSNVYPGFARHQIEEYKRALKFLFERRVAGWWCQERDLIQYNICTQEEFDQALGRKPRTQSE